MRDLMPWSVSCGRTTDVDVRLHLTLFVAVSGVLRLGATAADDQATMLTLGALVVYLLSLAVHEAAHALTARHWGGRIDCIIVGPVGGLRPLGQFSDPRCDALTALAGPAANLVLALVAAATVGAVGRPLGPLFFPFAPPTTMLELSVVGTIAQVAWINWLLFLVNTLPMFPLDGARFVSALMRRQFDAVDVLLPAARIGVGAAVVCIIASMFVGSGHDVAGFVLAALGIVGMFCSRNELLRGFDPDWTEAAAFTDPGLDDSDERRHVVQRPGPLGRWLENRRNLKHQRRMQTEREEEERADELLARLHTEGMQSLSPQDRALLQRVSARYRQRH